MNDIIFTILEAVLTASILAAMRYLIPFLIQTLRSHNYNLAAEIVEDAVRAAEQTLAGRKRGAEKYEHVMELMQETLVKYGIQMSTEQIDQLIESAVQAMNQEGGWLDPAVEVSE